jgi:hypothetical protein
MALYISSALVVIILVITFHRSFRPFGERHQIPINFLLALVGTFFGVFLSTQVSDWQNQKQSKQDAIILLNALTRDARNKIVAVRRTELGAGRSETMPDASLRLFYPSSLREIVMKDISLRNFSPEFVSNVNMYATFLESYMDTYSRNDLMAPENLKSVYDQTMSQLVIMMELEKYYVEGEVDADSHSLFYRCFFNRGSAEVNEDPMCLDKAPGMMKRMPRKFLELDEFNSARPRR